jgi:hypothetical protein
MKTTTLNNNEETMYSTIKFTPTEEWIFKVVDEMIGKKMEGTVVVEDITAKAVHPTDESFFTRNKSMLANCRHLAIKTRLGGPFIFERSAPVKKGRPVTDGMGNKAEYIVRRRINSH